MKQLFTVLFLSSLALQQSALAQSSAAMIAPAAPTAAAATPGAATSTATAAPTGPALKILYLGVYEGPNLTADGTNMHGDDTYVSNRPTLQYNFNSNTNAGLQTRIATTFTKTGVLADNQTWRLYGTFKNVAAAGIFSLDLIPRVQLPTSKANHNTTMMPSPELLAAFNINPKNSRFSFDYTPQMLGYVYSDSSAAAANNAASFIILHNIEGTYQLTSSSQLTFGWYPLYEVKKNNAFTNGTNEVDVGVNFDIAKGWSLNPYLGVEPNGMNSANITKQMEAALIVSGTFL